MRGISWLAANQLASQEGLCTMEYVIEFQKNKRISCSQIDLFRPMNAYRGSRGIALIILNLDTKMNRRWQLRPPAASIQGKNPGTYWTGGWMSPRTGINVLEKTKIFCPYRDSNPGPYTRSSIAILNWCCERISNGPHSFPYKPVPSHNSLLNAAAVWVRTPASYLEVPGSNLGLETENTGLCISLFSSSPPDKC